MASRCSRIINRASISSIRSAIKPKLESSTTSFPKSSLPSRSTSSPLRQFSFSRCPSELGCAASMLPLHSAVATARMTSCLSSTSRNCRALTQGNSVVLSYLMFLGFQPSSLIILSTFATFVVLAPLSFIIERHQWPKRLCLKLWIQLLLISFGGVTLFQSLLMKGIHLTSPAIATAMPNLAPGLIFFIAWAFRLEKVELSCKYSRAKIVGTMFCVIGAILMSILQDSSHAHSSKKQIHLPLQPLQAPPSYHHNGAFDLDKIMGSFYLVIAVFTLSSVIVLQAATLGDFPSPISISAITSLMGTVITIIVELIQHHRLEIIGFSKISVHALVAYSLLAGCISGASTSFNAWAMKKRGPVMVAVFGPVGTVISIMLSVIILGDSVTIGSLAGMFTMFTGLYFVLWAKGKEEFDYQSEYDLEKPLLS